jgi:hypothetical protein
MITNLTTLRFPPIRQWKCAAVGCANVTESWYRDGWLAIGSAQGLSDWERRTLVFLGVTQSSDLSVALVCDACSPKCLSALTAHEFGRAIMANFEILEDDAEAEEEVA